MRTIRSRPRSRASSLSSAAYPPPPSVLMPPRSTSRNFAPSERTCSPAAARTSYASTTAPSRRAVAMACRPATPAPMTNTFAGGMVPAAVISIGKSRGSTPAALMTALYPATVAMEESASIDWARLMRGTNSMLKRVTWRAMAVASAEGASSGRRKPMTAAPDLSRAWSDALGALTTGIRSASPRMDGRSPVTVAPAAEYASSDAPAALPAPDSTTTVMPWARSDLRFSGNRATRVSPRAVSLRMPKSNLPPQQMVGVERIQRYA